MSLIGSSGSYSFLFINKRKPVPADKYPFLASLHMWYPGMVSYWQGPNCRNNSNISTVSALIVRHENIFNTIIIVLLNVIHTFHQPIHCPSSSLIFPEQSFVVYEVLSYEIFTTNLHAELCYFPWFHARGKNFQLKDLGSSSGSAQFSTCELTTFVTGPMLSAGTSLT